MIAIGIILGFSICLQALTAFLALRIIKTTRYYWAWVFLALAVGLMAARRIVSFYELVVLGNTASISLSAEIIALAVSLLMFIGVLNVRPILKALYSAKAELENKNKQLEEEVEQRKNAENKAKINTEKFRKLADYAPVLIWMSDNSGQCTYFNERWLKYRGRTLDEEYGMGWTEGLHPDDKESTINDYLEAFEKRESFELEYRLQNKDNEYRWFYDIGTPMYDDLKNFTGYIGSCIDITERKKSKERIERSEREKSLILHAMQDKLIFLDKELKLQWTNQAALDIIAKEEQEAKGEYCYKLWHGYDSPCSDCPAKKALNTGNTEKAELAFEEGVFSIRAYPVEENSEITGVLVIAKNITERKQAEEQLKQSERKFRTFFYESTAIKLLIDPQTGNIIDGNRSAEEFYGYENLRSKKIQEINQLSEEEVKQKLKQAYFRNKNYFNFQHTLANGDMRYVEAHSTPLEIDGKKVIYSIIHDITDRVEARAALKRSERKFRKIVNALPQFVSYVDKNLIYRFVNQTYLTRFDKTEEDILGKRLNEVIGQETYNKAKPHIDRVLKGEAVHYTEFFRYPAGFNSYMKGTLIPEYGQNGKVEGYYAVLSDVTDIMENQKLLEESRNRLQILSKHQHDMLEKERSYIAREIHDELGQNLTAINMGLAMMKKQVPRTDRNLFSKIQELNQITHNALAKTKNLSSELRPQLIDDMGLISAIEWYIRNFEKRSGITCETDIPEEEPYLPKDSAIHIYRIIQECLTNVYKHAEAESIEVILRTELEFILLKIVDDGKGIGKSEAQKNNSFGLMGIEERVRLMDGEFKIEDSGNGTVVNVKIPNEQ
ncbi:MAG: PAS domain-containing sensor histidine kinase [Bacteroidota bacterium]